MEFTRWKGERAGFPGRQRQEEAWPVEGRFVVKTRCSTLINQGKQCGQKSKHEVGRTRAILPFHGVLDFMQQVWELRKGKAFIVYLHFMKVLQRKSGLEGELTGDRNPGSISL